MRWEDERYVRFYTRNTPEWMALSWKARGLFGLLLREVDRVGILKVGKLGLRGIAVAVGAPWVDVEDAVGELLTDGCIRFSESDAAVLVPNFIEAQEAAQSDRARQRKARELARAKFGGSASASEKARTVTNRDDIESQNVTKSHGASHGVTSCHSVPSVPIRAVPSVPNGEASATPTPDFKLQHEPPASGKPWTPCDVQRALADSSKGLYVASKPSKGHAITLNKEKSTGLSVAEARTIGEWLAAGGDWRTAKGQRLDARNLGDLPHWRAQARTWVEGGRRPLRPNSNTAVPAAVRHQHAGNVNHKI